jgi:hypothetical protein
MSLTASPSDASKPDTIAGLVELLARYGVRVYLQGGRLKVKKPWPTWEDTPGPVRAALKWLKARREKLRRHLEEQQEAAVWELYSWTLPVTDEEEARVRQAFEQGNENAALPIPERKRSTFLDRWPPLPNLVAQLEAAGFKLELDGETLKVTPPAPAEKVPPESLELYTQVTAREKAIVLHLRGRGQRENIRQNCKAYLPPGPDPMDYQFDPATGRRKTEVVH